MEIWQQISQQRVKHIVNSYHLEGSEPCHFSSYLHELLQTYPCPLIELALVETLIDQWLRLPMLKGIDFLIQTHDKLKRWEEEPIVSTITPEQFQQIAGLDPAPVFGSTKRPPTCSILYPS